MADYIALLKQEYDGCDYTIACGKDYVFFSNKSTDLKLIAENYLFQYQFEGMIDSSGDFDFAELEINPEYKLSELIIVSCDTGETFELNTEEFYEQCQIRINEGKKTKERLDDEIEFNRLKEKLKK